MDDNKKKLIQLKIEMDEWGEEVYRKKISLENKLNDFKCEMNLPDSEWEKDENINETQNYNLNGLIIQNQEE